MKSSLSQLALDALPLSVSAFPAFSHDAALSLGRVVPNLLKQEKRAVTFDPPAQLVDVSGENAFVPPNFATGDQRGPCPVLNALSNHNYLPHNGVAAWTDFANQTVSGI